METAGEHDDQHDDHQRDEHEHDDHQRDDHERDERDVRRLGLALGALDDDALRRGLAGLNEQSRLDVAGQLQLPKAAMHLGDALVPLVRRKVRAAAPARQLAVAFALSERVNDDTIAALGDRHEDPARDDMLEVLPEIVERHGAPLVTLMLASYAASDATCHDLFAELADTDERFALPDDLPPLDPGEAGTAPVAPSGRDGAEQADKRAQRKAAKAARRATEEQRRAARATAEAKRKEAQRAAKRSGPEP